jgi:hypothetical protein
MFQLTSVPVLSDVVMFLSAFVVLPQIWQFFDCASIALSEQYAFVVFPVVL